MMDTDLLKMPLNVLFNGYENQRDKIQSILKKHSVVPPIFIMEGTSIIAFYHSATQKDYLSKQCFMVNKDYYIYAATWQKKILEWTGHGMCPMLVLCPDYCISYNAAFTEDRCEDIVTLIKARRYTTNSPVIYNPPSDIIVPISHAPSLMC